jgi:hypothetical protein
MMIRTLVGVVVILFTLSACGTSQSAASTQSPAPTPAGSLTKTDGQVINPQNLPAPGTYEAAGLEMVVTDTGATLNTGCTKGEVATPITLNTDGSFTTSGTMNPLLPMNPPRQTALSLEGKYSEQDQVISVAITYGPTGDPQDYNLVLNGLQNLDAACPLN